MLSALQSVLSILSIVTAGAAAQEPPSVKHDTTFPVELRHTIHSKSAKVGDPVVFRTIESTLIDNGIVVPSDAELLGEVEEVQVSTRSSPESSLTIRIHTLRWEKNEVPLNAVVTGLFYAHASYLNSSPTIPKVTFMEGIHIVAHISDNAVTEFSRPRKEVVLRGGVCLLLRQIDPDNYRTVQRDNHLSASQ
jgi:hypothetical protein